MKTYQIILLVVFVLLTIIGYLFDKKEDEPLKEKIVYYRKPIMSLVFMSALLLCISSGLIVFSWAYNNEENDSLLSTITDNPAIVEFEPAESNESEENPESKPEINEKIKINFDYLKGINQDTIGWIEVEDTNINYPIVQTTDNDHYLKYSFENNENKSGWIFADYRNLLDGTDHNLIIYGHNRINGTMFGTLKKVMTKSWIESKDKHLVKLITDDYIYTYQIFSSYMIKQESYYIRTSFKSVDYEDFITTLLERSKYNYNVSVTGEDKILTLSTCATGNVKRIVVHAKLVNQVKHS